jgi:hypothetical protein
MRFNLDAANVATILVIGYAIVGAALVVLSAIGAVGDKDLVLSFNQYLESMAVAAGGLAVGRGLAARKG